MSRSNLRAAIALVLHKIADRLERRVPGPSLDDLVADGFVLHDDRPTNPDGFPVEDEPAVFPTYRSPPPEAPLEGSLEARAKPRW